MRVEQRGVHLAHVIKRLENGFLMRACGNARACSPQRCTLATALITERKHGGVVQRALDGSQLRVHVVWARHVDATAWVAQPRS